MEKLPDKFDYYNGNPPLMATARLFAAAHTMMQYEDKELYKALECLTASNQKEIEFLQHLLRD